MTGRLRPPARSPFPTQKYPTDAHPTTATGIWGVKQTGEVAAGDRVPPTSSWVGPTAVRSDICQTTRRSNLYIQVRAELRSPLPCYLCLLSLRRRLL